ncbi:MAG: hypothetical protein FWE22_06785 [Firmicutes bacterium]|nr:hypothetical protein [Bacillota bacterium]
MDNLTNLTEDIQFHNLKIQNVFELLDILMSSLDDARCDKNAVQKIISQTKMLVSFGEILVSKIDKDISELFRISLNKMRNT